MNLFLHPENDVTSTGLLSAVVGLILVVTGWAGGELSYRHRIGVLPRDQV